MSASAPAISVPPVTIDVVAHDRDLPLDVADHLAHLGRVVLGPHLVHDREVGLEHLAEAARHLRAARIRRDRDDLVAVRPLSR